MSPRPSVLPPPGSPVGRLDHHCTSAGTAPAGQRNVLGPGTTHKSYISGALQSGSCTCLDSGHFCLINSDLH